MHRVSGVKAGVIIGVPDGAEGGREEGNRQELHRSSL